MKFLESTSSVRNCLFGGAALLLVPAYSAFAGGTGILDVSDETVAPGGTVTVEFAFTNPSDAQAMDVDIVVSDPALVESMVLDCAPPGVGTSQCLIVADGNEDRIRINAFDSQPLPEYVGTVEFTISAGATPGDVISLEIDDSGDVNLLLADWDNGSITIQEGEPDDPVLGIDPASHDFGTIETGTSEVFTFTLSNDGTGELTIDTVGISGDGEFTVDADNCTGETLAEGEDCTVDVLFAPGVEGDYAGSLDVTSDANDVSAALTGAADDDVEPPSGPVLDIDPPFGPVDLGEGNAGDTLSADGSISNTGDEDLEVSCTLAGDAAISITPPSPIDVVLEPGGSVGFTLDCALPADADEGDTFGAVLSCTSNDPEQPAGEHAISCAVGDGDPEPPVAPTAIPTMQTWGLILMSMLMLLLGGLGIRTIRQ